MAVEFREVTIRFDPTRGRFPQRESATATFNARVQKAQAMLKGFHVQFTDEDHHVWQQQVDLDITTITANTVTVAADLGLRDSSGNVDDRYNGWVQAVIMADTAANPQT
jgi:hypothetical protein